MKRTLGLIIAVVMAAALFAGCEASEPSAGAGAGDTLGLISPGRTITVAISEHSNQPIKDYAPAQQEIYRQTGIKVQFEAFPMGVYPERLSIMLSTGQIPDIVMLNNLTDMNNFWDAGIFLPLMQYKDLMPNFMKLYEEDPNLEMLLRGDDKELYTFPVIRANESKGGHGPVIRTDLLKKHDLPIPTTWDEVIDVLSALREIYPDSGPWAPRRGVERGFLQTIAYMMGTGWSNANIVYYEPKQDKYVFGPVTEEFKNMFDYLNRAYEAGVFAPDFLNLTDELWNQSNSSGRSFFYVDNTGFSLNYSRDLQVTDPDARFEFIGSLENSYGERRGSWTYGMNRTFAINADIEDPETIIRFMDWLYSPEGTAITNFGVEGEHFYYDEEGEPQYIEDFVLGYKDVENAYYSIWSDLGITMLNFTPHAANTWSSFKIDRILGFYDEWQDKHQTMMDNDPGYSYGTLAPPMTTEESERVKELVADMTTFLDQQYYAFISGEKDIDEWDAVAETLIKMGAREVEDIWNAALDRARGK